MKNADKCPKCSSENIYADGNLWICPECSYEWSAFSSATDVVADVDAVHATEPQENVIRDANGNVLNDGDSVIVIKELKIKGSSSAVKV